MCQLLTFFNFSCETSGNLLINSTLSLHFMKKIQNIKHNIKSMLLQKSCLYYGDTLGPLDTYNEWVRITYVPVLRVHLVDIYPSSEEACV